MNYPYNRPGPGGYHEKDVYWDHKPQFVNKDFNYATPSILNITAVNWNQIIGLTCLEDSSEGVVFLESEDGALVLKASSDPAGPLFANFMYMELGIDVPLMRVLTFKDANFEDM